ncbi:ferrochelatase [Myroides pelagicus]|uniref:Ferrochelatase n=1 Tax=Myroides pelagicus TaxID=270914 RepID=A0A7K1GPW3_9FLAO|nr:ferrochelatase [Myroides pelagicus]MEC4112692.1 ferrochelatase [Myroides pelagicus]MTH30907.1 ferrochelatase [Myroides pelagicus]
MQGILLVNLGSPKSPTAKDVKPYLDEFLMDERVIDVPYLLRAFLVRGIILNTRPKKSAEAYKKIWWPEGSPLIVISERQQKKVQELIDIPVALAMRYGEPSIKTGIEELKAKGVSDILMIPLYPQFAMATTETIDVLAKNLIKKHFPEIKLTSLPAFYNKPEYIEALAESIKSHLEGFDYDHLLFSYHGVPERHIKKSDITKSHCQINNKCCVTNSKAHEFCYRHQCLETTRQVVEKLNIPEGKYSSSFQSKLGPDKWLQPPTDDTVNEFPTQGIKKLAVVTPAFVADCIETLEEIGLEAHHEFINHGGEEFRTIPCLNDDDLWINALVTWIKEWKNN